MLESKLASNKFVRRESIPYTQEEAPLGDVLAVSMLCNQIHFNQAPQVGATRKTSRQPSASGPLRRVQRPRRLSSPLLNKPRRLGHRLVVLRSSRPSLLVDSLSSRPSPALARSRSFHRRPSFSRRSLPGHNSPRREARPRSFSRRRLLAHHSPALALPPSKAFHQPSPALARQRSRAFPSRSLALATQPSKALARPHRAFHHRSSLAARRQASAARRSPAMERPQAIRSSQAFPHRAERICLRPGKAEAE